MTIETKNAMHLSPAQRKSALVARGAGYRAGIVRSKNVVQANLHADALALGAMRQFATRSSTVVGALLGLNSLRKGNLRALAPLLATGLNMLAKRGAVKPLARGAAVLAAVGAGAFFIIRKKRAARLSRTRRSK
jgi:hypothetical protein